MPDLPRPNIDRGLRAFAADWKGIIKDVKDPHQLASLIERGVVAQICRSLSFIVDNPDAEGDFFFVVADNCFFTIRQICAWVALYHMGPRPHLLVAAGQIRDAGALIASAMRTTLVSGRYLPSGTDNPQLKDTVDYTAFARVFTTVLFNGNLKLSPSVQPISLSTAEESPKLCAAIWLNDRCTPSHMSAKALAVSSALIDAMNLPQLRPEVYGVEEYFALLTNGTASWDQLVGRCFDLGWHSADFLTDTRVMLYLSILFGIQRVSAFDDEWKKFFEAFVSHQGCRAFNRSIHHLAKTKKDAVLAAESPRNLNAVETIHLVHRCISVWTILIASGGAEEEAVSEDFIGCFEILCLLWIRLTPKGRATVTEADDGIIFETVIQDLRTFFLRQISSPQRFMEAARQLSRSAQRIPAASSVVKPNLHDLWHKLDSDIREQFDQLAQLVQIPPAMFEISRCSVASCARAWGADGAMPMVCAICRTTYYCSKACQRADWKTHRPVCRAESAAAGA